MSQAAPAVPGWQRALRLFTPAPQTRKFLLVALILPLGVLGCFLVMLFTSGPDSSELSGLEVFLLVVGFFLLPLTAVVLGLAAWREPRHPPRAVLWLSASLLFFTGGLMVTLMMFLDPEMEKSTAVVFLLVSIAPLALLFSLPAVYSAARALPEWRAALQESVEERALAYITARGAVSFVELAHLLDIPLGEVDDLLDSLLRGGRLAGTMDARRGIVYGAAYLAEGQRRMLEAIHLHGRMRIDELARLLQTSPSTITDWLYQLVQRGQFHGYIHWSKRLVYASTAHQIGAGSQCPACGGTLAPGGGERIVCLHCGTEMW